MSTGLPPATGPAVLIVVITPERVLVVAEDRPCFTTGLEPRIIELARQRPQLLSVGCQRVRVSVSTGRVGLGFSPLGDEFRLQCETLLVISSTDLVKPLDLVLCEAVLLKGIVSRPGPA